MPVTMIVPVGITVLFASLHAHRTWELELTFQYRRKPMRAYPLGVGTTRASLMVCGLILNGIK